jgi:hypothetical protein
MSKKGTKRGMSSSLWGMVAKPNNGLQLGRR